MEEKKSKLSIAVVLLILAIIIIAVMAVFMYKLYNDKKKRENTITALHTDVDNMIKGLADKNTEIYDLTEQIEILSKEIEEKNVTEEKIQEKDYEDVVLDGSYSIPNTDASATIFTKDGKVYDSVEISDPSITPIDTRERTGRYKTIAPNIIEINFNKERVTKNREETINDINEYLYAFVFNNRVIWLNEYLSNRVTGDEKLSEANYQELE